MGEVCFSCGRKASRRCIAEPVLELGGLESGQRRICSECCGKGRGRAIDCPDTCPHYQAGAQAALIKLVELGEDPDMEMRYGDVLHNLRLGLARVRRDRLRDLKDGEARQAFASAAETMRVRSSGLVFSFRSTDPQVQMLGDELLWVATLHERGENGMARTNAADLMRCLRYLERQAAAAGKQGRGDTLYLDLVVQSVASGFLTRDSDGLVEVVVGP